MASHQLALEKGDANQQTIRSDFLNIIHLQPPINPKDRIRKPSLPVFEKRENE
jgi:hypothetical protein